MAAINDITGDYLVSKSNTEKFRSNYDKIFSKPKADKPKADKPKVVKGKQ
jgi:hypothetical protein